MTLLSALAQSILFFLVIAYAYCKSALSRPVELNCFGTRDKLSSFVVFAAAPHKTRFQRCHCGHPVNVQKSRETFRAEPGAAVPRLKTGREVPVSRRDFAALQQRLRIRSALKYVDPLSGNPVHGVQGPAPARLRAAERPCFPKCPVLAYAVAVTRRREAPARAEAAGK